MSSASHVAHGCLQVVAQDSEVGTATLSRHNHVLGNILRLQTWRKVVKIEKTTRKKNDVNLFSL